MVKCNNEQQCESEGFGARSSFVPGVKGARHGPLAASDESHMSELQMCCNNLNLPLQHTAPPCDDDDDGGESSSEPSGAFRLSVPVNQR